MHTLKLLNHRTICFFMSKFWCKNSERYREEFNLRVTNTVWEFIERLTFNSWFRVLFGSLEELKAMQLILIFYFKIFQFISPINL